MTQIQVRRGSAAEWLAANPVLGPGEQGFELDSGKLKIGDGSARWTDLDYFIPEPVVREVVASALAEAPGITSPDVREIKVLTQDEYAASEALPDVLYVIVATDAPS